MAKFVGSDKSECRDDCDTSEPHVVTACPLVEYVSGIIFKGDYLSLLTFGEKVSPNDMGSRHID